MVCTNHTVRSSPVPIDLSIFDVIIMAKGKEIYLFFSILSAPSEGCTKQSQRTKLVRPSGLCMLAGISEGTHMISKKIFALLSATDIEVKFLVFRLKIILRLFSSRQSGWIILYLESTSKSVCTCYRKHQPQMKHYPEESVSSIMAMGGMPHFPQKNIIGNFKWVSMKRGQSSCSKLWDLQISLGIQYRTLSPWGWDTLVLTLFSMWYIILSF